MGYKRAVVVLVTLYAVGRVLQFFSKKKPPSGRGLGGFVIHTRRSEHGGT